MAEGSNGLDFGGIIFPRFYIVFLKFTLFCLKPDNFLD